MSKTAWVIMKNSTYPNFFNIPTIYMIGFKSKKEAETQCGLLNKKSTKSWYYTERAKLFQPTGGRLMTTEASVSP